MKCSFVGSVGFHRVEIKFQNVVKVDVSNQKNGWFTAVLFFFALAAM